LGKRIKEARDLGIKVPDIIKKFEVSRKAIRNIFEQAYYHINKESLVKSRRLLVY
jgi:hypothetical protein